MTSLVLHSSWDGMPCLLRVEPYRAPIAGLWSLRVRGGLASASSTSFSRGDSEVAVTVWVMGSGLLL